MATIKGHDGPAGFGKGALFMPRSRDDQAAIAAMFHCVPVSDQQKAQLLQLLSAPDRHYHNTRHIADLWRRHQALCPGTGMDDAAVQQRLSAAILWHDAIYVAGRTDNERKSAALWRQAAMEAGIPQPVVDWVAAAITATADHVGARSGQSCHDDRVLQWLLDLDLTPLGETPAMFARTTARLTKEHARNPDPCWQQRRLDFLRRVASCPQVFVSPVIAAAYEAQARANLARELSHAGG